MNLERIPLSIPDLRGRESEYLTECVTDNWVSSAGPFVTEMENRMARLCGRGHAVATVNGTAALHLAMLAAGIGEGDHVIVPDWTFAASANAILHAGAIPVFVDVTEDTWTLDPELVAATIEVSQPVITAVMPVHVLGHPAEMDTLAAASGELPIIEDSAGAIGAYYKGQHVGRFGAVSAFSFNGNKTVTAGGGGMVLTDDEESALRIRHLSTQARTGADYTHDAIGFNYRMTNLNAAVGLAQLERLDEMVAIKRLIAARYDNAIAERDDVSAMPRAAWADSSCWLYSVRTASSEDAENLVKRMADARIEARVFWRSLSAQAAYAFVPSRLSGVSAALSGQVVSLPCSSSLTEHLQARVIDVLGDWRGSACERAT
jgi:dTDP-4-amino-4,6-dideoxygalactose transaminase